MQPSEKLSEMKPPLKNHKYNFQWKFLILKWQKKDFLRMINLYLNNISLSKKKREKYSFWRRSHQWDQQLYCKIGEHYWNCAGLPYQFFAITLIVSLVLLALFSVHSVYVLFWIQPWTSSFKSLQGIMTNFEGNFKKLENSYNSKGNLNR